MESSSGQSAESSGFNVVAIGGGTGLSTLLRGLKLWVPHEDGRREREGHRIRHLTAIVTVTDDGGSSGRLRAELGVPPPGDIRNCMTALSEDEALMSRLFQYRFSHGEGLEGHSFGNLFLTALTQITGDFAHAVKLSSAILKTRGEIYPATNANVGLEARMDDGSRVRGETRITASRKRIVRLELVPPDAEPLPAAVQALGTADIITIGPGSLFTSVLPNLLVHGLADALRRSRALKVCIGNLMTQANESLDLTAAQHIEMIFEHCHGRLFDYVMLNDTPVTDEMRRAYAAEHATQTANDLEHIRALGVEPLCGPYLETCMPARHRAERVAADVLALAERVRDQAPRAVARASRS